MSCESPCWAGLG